MNFNIFRLLLLKFCFVNLAVSALNEFLVVDFCAKLINSQYTIVFGCSQEGFLNLLKSYNYQKRYIQFVNIKTDTVNLMDFLKRFEVGSTCLTVDLDCKSSTQILKQASTSNSFNISYQWFITSENSESNKDISEVIKPLTNIRLNSQITYSNKSTLCGNISGAYDLFDIHSKGQHLGSPIEIQFYTNWTREKGFGVNKINLQEIQGMKARRNFNGLTLRGVVVIDRDNLTSEQLVTLVTQDTKVNGVTSFTKYYFALNKLLEDVFNFTINYRSVRSWAGYLGNSTFRIGLLGVLQRNEADISANGVFPYLHRLSVMDCIHQSWEFSGSFIFRYTEDLESSSSAGSFLKPFENLVWISFAGSLILTGAFWVLAIIIRKRYKTVISTVEDENETMDTIIFNLIAATSQQGIDPISNNFISKTIILFLLIFSFLMYNFYTSSVVGGLLSFSQQGPKTLEDIVNSPLILSAENIGYNKVVFQESNRPAVQRVYREHILPKRKKNVLPAYASIKDAVPFLKAGGYAFHCEATEIYPDIARTFTPNEICGLRLAEGLIISRKLSNILPKRSQYTEFFKVMIDRIDEHGIMRRLLRIYRPEKPTCEANSVVYPVAFNGILKIIILLGYGMLISVIILIIEILVANMGNLEMQP